MLKHYITSAWRNLQKHKGYTSINIFGLAVGMACCLLITIYVQDELSYDRYHLNVDRIYRVLHGFQNFNEGEKLPPPTPEELQVWGNAPIGPALAADFPEIQKLVQFTHPYEFLLEFEGNRYQEENMLFMDSTAFDIFSWKFIYGNPDLALVAPYSIVLTEKVAHKYFGDTDPVGQRLKMENSDYYTVTGVLEVIPANSHFNFNALISMSTFRKLNPDIFEWWGYVDFYTYFLIPENTDIASLEAKIPDFVKRHVPPDMTYTFAFEPLTDAYLHSVAGRQPGTTGSLTNVYIFSIIAVFILLIACINFMNLSTARSIERSKEVGVRKVAGAHRWGLIQQFLGESLFLSLLAAALALIFSKMSLPALTEISGKDFFQIGIFSAKNVLFLFSASVLVGLLAGSYPAWVLSRFRPAHIIKDVSKTTLKGVFLRQGLVVFQFSLSIALIAGTAIVFAQLKYLRSRDLGFSQEQMLVIDYGDDGPVKQKLETIKTEFLNHPDVIGVSASRAVPGDFLPNAYSEIQSPQGEMVGHAPLIYEIDFDFFSNFEIEIAAGRDFSRNFPVDTSQSLLVNEAAAELYGYANPEDIIGKKFSQWGREGTVVGVVKNFNFRSLHNRVEPLSIRYRPLSTSRLSLRISSDNMSKTIGDIEQTWNKLVPHRPFVYSFLDDSFNLQYQADQRFGQIFRVFAVLAIFIACLGLLGLATFTAKQRTKEIGIRKVLGASVTNIVTLLSKDFMKLIIMAILVATPLCWLAMSHWLNEFAYKIDITIDVFIVAGIVAIAIALATISWQSVRAALANPVNSLRNE
ncbi:ABC transporter permease [soil metagenome]